LLINSPAYKIASENRSREIQALDDARNREILRRAEEQKAIQQARLAAVERQEAMEKEIKGYSIEAIKFGADSEAARFIQEAPTPEIALQRAAQFLGKEFAMEMEAKAFDRRLQEANYELSVAKFDEDIRQFGEQQALEKYKLAETRRLQEMAIAEKKAEKEKSVEAEQQAKKIQLDLLDNRLTQFKEIYDPIQGKITHAGFNSRVGPTSLARSTFAIKDAFGAGNAFAGIIHQLTDGETLENLVRIKSRGATFGALQEKELELLKNAATAINHWEKKKDGVGRGVWDIDEKTFEKEFRKLYDYAVDAYEVAGGTFLEDDDMAEIGGIMIQNQLTNPNVLNLLTYY
jgi:predicted RNase H-related nuclease YkuK (DUF458 family)